MKLSVFVKLRWIILVLSFYVHDIDIKLIRDFGLVPVIAFSRKTSPSNLGSEMWEPRRKSFFYGSIFRRGPFWLPVLLLDACLLLSALVICFRLPSSCCLSFAVFFLLPAVCTVLSAFCCLLPAVCYLSSSACLLLSGPSACILLPLSCCQLSASCLLLLASCCFLLWTASCCLLRTAYCWWTTDYELKSSLVVQTPVLSEGNSNFA